MTSRHSSLSTALVCALLAALPTTACQSAPAAPAPAPATVRIAVCQTLCIASDVDGNLRRIEHAVEDAASQGAQLACFPETAVIGWINAQAHQLATPIPGDLSNRIAAMARKHDVMISIGLCERQGEQLFDSAVLFDTDGAILHTHRKVNTIDKLMDPPYTRGKVDNIATVSTRLGRIGMLICADTFHQPCVDKLAALKPELVLVPYGWAATPESWPTHGESMEAWARHVARTVGCPVVGTDLVGSIDRGPWRGRTYGGQSVVIDADGATLGVLRDRDVDVRTFDIAVGSATREN